MLVDPITYLITPGDLTTSNFHSSVNSLLKIVEAAVFHKISLIQVREKELSSALLHELVSMIISAARRSETKIIVNERADIAAAAGAHGVHLRSDSMSALKVRSAFPHLITIISCHNIPDIEQAKAESADMVTFSPIFDAPNKDKAKGIEELLKAVKTFPELPILALGGIDLTNYKQTLESGAAGFAAIRSLNNTDNLRRLNFEIQREKNLK